MSEKLVVASRLKDYEVDFIEDFEETFFKSHPVETSFVISDARLLEIYGESVAKIFKKYHTFPIEATEHHKTLDFCQTMIRMLIEKNIRKNCTLIAVGGGVIQDITAFISSILFRGIDWVFYPTTLLAQADSCIGSKTSINLGEFKNILGGFFPPSRIHIDLRFLETLPTAEIKSGIGEILHFFLIANSDLTIELEQHYDQLLTSPRMLHPHIKESLAIKKKVIEIDEFDTNERNLFNYGHTFGHAIESVTEYEVNHGQAVTMGMDIANYISLKLGYLDKQDFDYMHKALAHNMPSFELEDNLIESYFRALSRDKKNTGNNLVCILTTGPGRMKKESIPLDDNLKNMIRAYHSFSKA